MSHRSEWTSSKNLQTINAGEGVEKREKNRRKKEKGKKGKIILN